MAKDEAYDMEGHIVYVDEKEYTIGHYLASGLQRIVFFATNTSDPLDRVVVKVPAPNPHQELRRFWDELEVYNLIKMEWNKIHINDGKPFPLPNMLKGKNLKTNQDFLVMEYVDYKEELPHFLTEFSNGLKRQLFLIEVASQYADLLGALHRAGKIRVDIKLRDLYWKENEKRLIVLDWDTVAELDNARNDIGLDFYNFGSLWYQLITGHYPSPNMDLLDDNIWNDTDVAFRYLLLQALSPYKSLRYQTDQEFSEAIAKVRERLSSS